MLFKAIVTVLLFIIHTAIEARFSRWFPSPIYSVAIEGKLICPSYPKGFALVMISNNKKPKPDHRPIAKIYAKFYRAFFLSKMFKHWGRQPRLYVKIFHRCKQNKDNYERMLSIKIPRSHVTIGKRKNIYNLKVIDLSNKGIPTNTRVAILYGKELIPHF